MLTLCTVKIPVQISLINEGSPLRDRKTCFLKKADLCDLENKHISPGVNVYLSELVRMQINTHGWKNDCRL